MDEQNTIETPETNYIELLNQMKQNTVSKDEYNRVLADNKKLAQSLVTSAPSAEEPEVQIPTDADVNIMRENLLQINGHMSNLDFTKKMLDLRDAIIARGGEDPFLPKNTNAQITDFDRAKAEEIANGLRQMANYAGNDASLFNSELKRCCK